LELFFVNGGGTSKYDLIAHELGYKIGVNSGGKYKTTLPIKMIDNNWLNYCHDTHLSLIKTHRPELATVQDIEDISQIKSSLDMAEEILPYCSKVILIPKINCMRELKAFSLNREDQVLLGYPVGRYEVTERLDYYLKSNLMIHLLGGSFKKIYKHYKEFGSIIFSMDSNYVSRIAGYGKIVTITGDRKPDKTEVSSGKDFNYRCFEYSMRIFKEIIDSEPRNNKSRSEILGRPRQLSLFNLAG
jgi:hypothetical protein